MNYQKQTDEEMQRKYDYPKETSNQSQTGANIQNPYADLYDAPKQSPFQNNQTYNQQQNNTQGPFSQGPLNQNYAQGHFSQGPQNQNNAQGPYSQGTQNQNNAQGQPQSYGFQLPQNGQPQQNQFGGGNAYLQVEQSGGYQDKHMDDQKFCEVCKKWVFTRIEYVSGLKAYLCCISLAIMGLCFGCCLIPFCCDQCKQAIHYCPECNSVIQ